MRFKPDYYYNQSGTLPYRVEGEEVQVLLITSRKRKRWILPKGVIEPHLSPTESALKETEEEAGVRGAIGLESLGVYEKPKWGGVCRIEVFPLRVDEVLANWPEAGIRERRWFPLAQAAQLLAHPRLEQMCHRLEALLGAEPSFAG